MKKVSNFLVVLGVASLMTMPSCKKILDELGNSAGNNPGISANVKLIEYKNSDHRLMGGYFSRETGDTAGILNLIPDSVDIINIWGRQENSADWEQELQIIHDLQKNKGMKFIVTGWLDDLNSRFGPKDASGAVNNKNWRTGVTALRDSVIKWKLDGIDFDIEPGIIPESNDSLVAIMTELAKYFGPTSTPPTLSNAKLMFIWDTNMDGNFAPYTKTYKNYDLVYLQAYWRNANSLTNTYNTFKNYIPQSKFLAGVDFEDETGFASNQMPAYAAWATSQNMGGVFSYKIERDYANQSGSFSSYAITRAAIQTMNPAKKNK
ncbi:Glycosyl hydrolases family 18 [Chitinophaga costaii]|uniref:mannosyl-glycoprotein endo-beta-N-acetylglucosaminidase n=1 Tax=Chitinophaga costaii TaxID=1335309 RepID=A0A1C4FUS9_9BACT|nr:glycoside hydrolase family 18 [Chitinophaga costaii]SCC59271.1 Glycosyl hydrolases family 18 [Chitinophaga costaii]